jgi:hypothetical protein
LILMQRCQGHNCTFPFLNVSQSGRKTLFAAERIAKEYVPVPLCDAGGVDRDFFFALAGGECGCRA